MFQIFVWMIVLIIPFGRQFDDVHRTKSFRNVSCVFWWAILSAVPCCARIDGMFHLLKTACLNVILNGKHLFCFEISLFRFKLAWIRRRNSVGQRSHPSICRRGVNVSICGKFIKFRKLHSPPKCICQRMAEGLMRFNCEMNRENGSAILRSCSISRIAFGWRSLDDLN